MVANSAFDLSHNHRDSSELIETFASMAIDTRRQLVPIAIEIYGNSKWRVPHQESQWGYSITLCGHYPGLKISNRTIANAEFLAGGIQLTEMIVHLVSESDTTSPTWKNSRKLPY
ncbi:hypothetical protein GF382_00925 [Candidatus Falkowbacteria bacterium]|nr:hypothetical protein [Candidatus Falkowbacteria bacterium]